MLTKQQFYIRAMHCFKFCKQLDNCLKDECVDYVCDEHVEAAQELIPLHDEMMAKIAEVKKKYANR
jgi:hypothetical protein